LIDFTILQTPESLWRDRAYNRRDAIFCAGTGLAGCMTIRDPDKPKKLGKPLRKTAVTEALLS
jgi:hypothetical protein